MQRCMKCMKEFQDGFEMCPHCGHEVGTPQKELYFLPVGTMIQGRYEIGQSAGSGGFGITYRAWDHTLDKEVAVKEYYPVGMVNRIPGEVELIIYSGSRAKECAAGMQRFLDEARNMAKFNTHPNIINVYDFFEANNTAYIIMEFLDGINYKEYIKKHDGKIELETALHINDAVLDALKEVHSSGILHRDISPDNVFICNDGKIKLIDFGAARFSDLEKERTRSVILKPGYAPPEQYQTKSKQGPWTDIYATGAMLYRAVTGVVPEESVNRVEEDNLKPPIEFCKEINKNQSNAIMRSMSILPELRFQDVESFKKALTGEIKVREVSKELNKRKKNRAFLIMAGSALVLVGAIVSLIAYNQKKSKAAILNEATVSLWTYADSDETVEEKKALMEDALSEFCQEYEQVAVEVTVYEKEEYAQKIEEAISSNTMPTLFESSLVDTEQLSNMKDVEDVFDFIETDSFYFLKDYSKYFASKKQIPLSFIVPVNYVNNMLNTDSLTADELIKKGDFLASADSIYSYYNSYQGNVFDFKHLSESDVSRLDLPEDKIDIYEKRFLNNEVPCLVSDSSKYELIQANMAGIYKIEFVQSENLLGEFTDVFSISQNSSQDEKAAAVQILVYLLAENGQDILYVQDGCHMPLNRVVFNSYLEINHEFNGIIEEFGKLDFAGEKQYLLENKGED